MNTISTRPRWIVTAADGVTIQKMTMRHAGNSALIGAISNDGYSNWTLQDSTLSDAHAANAGLDGGSNVRILRNDIGHAGLDGVSGPNVNQGGLVQGNHIHDNRTADAAFKRSWGASGLKITQVQGFVVDANEVDHNDSTGLWCDVGCSNVTFRPEPRRCTVADTPASPAPKTTTWSVRPLTVRINRPAWWL